MEKFLKLMVAVGACGLLNACSSIYPLGSVAKRTEDPRSLAQDVRVDLSSRHAPLVKRMAWVAYSVTFDCPKTCPYTNEERQALSTEIAETSFAAFDRELRRALGTERELAQLETVRSLPAFGRELSASSYKSAVSRWLRKLGLGSAGEVTAAAQGLKIVNPSELGWTGGESLAVLARELGQDGVLVGHIRVTPAEQNDAQGPGRLVIHGPQIWLFSTTTSAPVVVAGLRPAWRLEMATGGGEAASAAVASTGYASRLREPVAPTKLSIASELQTQRLDWRGLDAVASGFSSRVAQALQ